MASKASYKTKAVVLRKTKLAERDLVITLITESGELMRAVAKGARKPGGSFAAKLELFSLVDVMAAPGRTLDVITDARFASGGQLPTFGLEQAACASCSAELLASVCQEGLEQPRLFDMAKATFSSIAASPPEDALAISAASLLKIISSAGFRPSVDSCQACGCAIDLSQHGEKILFSVSDGGATCAGCARTSEGFYADTHALAWCKALLYSTYDEIAALKVGACESFAVLQLVKPWVEFHVGKSMKSLTYLLSSGLF